MSLFSFKQTDKYNAVDKYVTSLDKKVKTKGLVVKPLENMSIPGGAVTGYYLNKKLVLIKTIYGGEFGYNAYSFYFRNDSLLYVNEIRDHLEIPETEEKYDEYEKYIKTHTDKYGHQDLTKLPHSESANNIYYLINDSIVKYSLRNFNKAVNATENEVAKTNKDIIYRYKTHIIELK